MRKYIILLSMILLIVSSAWAADYYVDNDGSGGDGSSGNPWGPTEITWGSMGSGDTLYVVDTLFISSPFSIGSEGSGCSQSSDANRFIVKGDNSNSGIIYNIDQAGPWVDQGGGVWAYTRANPQYVEAALEYTADVSDAQALLPGSCAGTPLISDPIGTFCGTAGDGKLYWKPYSGTIIGKTFAQVPGGNGQGDEAVQVQDKDCVKIGGLIIHGGIGVGTASNSPSHYFWLENGEVTTGGKNNAINVGIESGVTASNNGRISGSEIHHASNGVYFRNQTADGTYDPDGWWIGNNYLHTLRSCSDAHGLGVQGARNFIIEDNWLTDSGSGITFWMKGTMQATNNIVRYNWIWDMNLQSSDFPWCGAGWLLNGYRSGIEFTTSTGYVSEIYMTGNKVYTNIIYNMEDTGIRHKFSAISNEIYNNVVGSSSPNFNHQVGGTANQLAGFTMKNNISFNPDSTGSGCGGNCQYHVYMQDENWVAGTVLDRNLYYPDTGTKFYVASAVYNFLGWKAYFDGQGMNGEDNSPTPADPLFMDSSYDSFDDFRLRNGSPGSGAGENVGIKLFDPGDTIWPPSRIDQDALPEIGVFGHIPIYYMRANGSATQKTDAVGPCTTIASTMSLAVHAGEVFSPTDRIHVCAHGGDFSGILTPPSSGLSGEEIEYEGVLDGSNIPTLNGFDSNGQDYLIIHGIEFDG